MSNELWVIYQDNLSNIETLTGSLCYAKLIETLFVVSMTDNTLTLRKSLYILLLTALNIFGLIMVSVVFLGASAANEEGAPMQSGLMVFFRQLSYVVTISICFSFVAWLLTHLFRNSLSINNPFIKNIFWIQLGGLIGSFLLSFIYIQVEFS